MPCETPSGAARAKKPQSKARLRLTSRYPLTGTTHTRQAATGSSQPPVVLLVHRCNEVASYLACQLAVLRIQIGDDPLYAFGRRNAIEALHGDGFGNLHEAVPSHNRTNLFA